MRPSRSPTARTHIDDNKGDSTDVTDASPASHP